MEPAPFVYREEVTAMLMTLADIDVNVRSILQILRDDHGEEEEELARDA